MGNSPTCNGGRPVVPKPHVMITDCRLTTVFTWENDYLEEYSLRVGSKFLHKLIYYLLLVRWNPTLSFATVPLAENAGQAADNPCQQHTDHGKYPHICEGIHRAFARFIIIRVECWGSKRFLGRSQNWKIINMFWKPEYKNRNWGSSEFYEN